MDFDVIVIGAGAMGSSAAYQLSKNMRVLLLEQFAFGHTNGSSHGESRIIRLTYEQDYFVSMMYKAYAAWDRIRESTERNFIHKKGGLDFGPPDSPRLLQTIKSIEKIGIKFERLNAKEMRGRFPNFNIPGGYIGIYQPDAGILNPDEVLPFLQNQAKAQGCTMKDEEEVLSIQRLREGIKVITSKGEYTSKKVVITAGAWLKNIAEDLGIKLGYLQIWQVAFMYFKQRESVDSPIFICWEEPVFYGFPEFEKDGYVKIAPHFSNKIIDDISKRDPEVNSELVKLTTKFAERMFPGLNPTPEFSERCLYTITPDDNFIIDYHPKNKNILFCGGFSGHGFKFTALIGEVVRDLILTGESDVNLEHFKIKI